MSSVVKAFLIAPVLPFLIYGPFAVIVVIMGVPAYIATIVFGIPLYLFLRRHPRWQTDYIYALCGGLIGILVAYLLLFKTRDTDYYGLLFGLYHGSASGYIFWRMTRAKPVSSVHPAEKMCQMTNVMDITIYTFFRALTTLPFVEAIYLYGSRARGDATTHSDIDLAILCSEATPIEWQNVLDIIEDADTLLKIDCVRLDTLHDGRLKTNILEDGVKLYGKA